MTMKKQPKTYGMQQNNFLQNSNENSLKKNRKKLIKKYAELT